MINRLLIIFVFVLSAVGCKAENKETPTTSTISGADTIETVMNTFSTAIAEKNVKLFLNITDTKGIYLVRKFTSGNLGARGPELSELINPTTINEKLQFPIKNQTSYNIKIHFPELPLKSFKDLPRRTLFPEVETISFDQWEAILKKNLGGAPEVIKGDPLLLTSSSSKYWVYTEAQIIDDILVGGFAVFTLQDEKIKLVSVIELL